jgi:RNA polymerase sigma-70 factor (ECF subfamily)
VAIESFALNAHADPARGPRSDSILIRELIEGSHDALADLYDRHAQAVFAAALRVSRDRGIAAEVVQDTFLTMWNRAELFDPSRGALAAWLLAIARNRTIDRMRAATRHERAASFSSFGRDEADDQSTVEWLTSTGDLIGVAGPEPGPEMALSDKETRESIQDALAALPPLERRVIELAYDSGLSQSEIAAQLGWPMGTVKTRTRRALRHLRERLEGAHMSAEPQDTMPETGRGDPKAWHPAASSAHPARIASPCMSPC